MPPKEDITTDDPLPSRASVVLRVLRRTVIGGNEQARLLDRLTREVGPTTEDLIDALVEAHGLSHADPARERIINVLGMALDARSRRNA